MQPTGALTRGVTLREIPPRPPKSTDHPWVAAFLKALAREDLAAVTVRGYRSDLGLFATWYDGYPLEKLTASDLAQFRHYLSRERAMKPASVNRGCFRVPCQRRCSVHHGPDDLRGRWPNASHRLQEQLVVLVGRVTRRVPRPYNNPFHYVAF
jgi:hypothetical protein